MSIRNRQTIRNRIRPFQWCMLGCMLLILAVALWGCKGASTSPKLPTTRCERIVSLSPSVTEILYALNLENRVAGVTRFCLYPPAARKKPSVGGYVDPDMETLLRLRPDLVIIRQEQTRLVEEVKNLKIPVLTIDHRDTAGILKSFEQIGRVCHRKKEAKAYTDQLQARIVAIRQKVQAATTQPKVLVGVDRGSQNNHIRWIYVAGEDGFYNWLIEQAGGKNATPVGRKGFLQISSEGILRLNPDIIIETLPSIGGIGQDQAEARKAWASLPQVNAVKNDRVYLFSEDYMVIPGPRFVNILEKFAQAIHPELDWKHHDQSPSSPLHP
jgi:iron complex transport system substrate-binding protein